MQKLHDTTGKIQKLNDTLKPPTIKHTYDILKPPKVLLMHVKPFPIIPSPPTLFETLIINFRLSKSLFQNFDIMFVKTYKK